MHAGLHAPRIGFYGIIDERLDLDLVAGLADARPDWVIVMVGPVVKIEQAALPRRTNIRWIGMQTYETLEYLAAGLPVVTTPIRDVISFYGEVVRVASTVRAFADAVEAALDERDEERARRSAIAQGILDRSTWNVAAAWVLDKLEPHVGRALTNFGMHMDIRRKAR